MKGGANTGEVLVISLGLIILIIMSMFLYNFFNQTNKTTNKIDMANLIGDDDIHDATIHENIDSSVLPRNNLGNEYNYNLWIYISHFEPGPKTILKRENNGALSPKIMIASNTNDLIIELTSNSYDKPDIPQEEEEGEEGEEESEEEEENKPDTLGSHKSMPSLVNTKISVNKKKHVTTKKPITTKKPAVLKKYQFRIKSIPLQKWLNINVAVNNNNLDVFMNGNLKGSFIIPGIVPRPSGQIKICPNGGFNGFISRTTYANQEFDIDTIKQTYRSGPYKTGAIETKDWLKNLYLFNN